MTGNIIVKPSVQQRFDSFMERGRVLFFSAPCGFGKSTLSDALLSGRDVLRLTAGAADLFLGALCAAGMTGIALRLRMNPFRLYAFAVVALGMGAYAATAGRLFRALYRLKQNCVKKVK